MWLCRKVSQLWDFSPPPLSLTMYLRIVSGQGGSKPSSTKCPWIVSALHRTFSRLKRRIRARVSGLMVGRPPFRRDFHRHHCRKATACHWRTVLGFIRSAADFHPPHTLDSNTHKRRNAGVKSRTRLSLLSNTFLIESELTSNGNQFASQGGSLPEKGRDKDQDITDGLPAEYK